MAWIHLIRLLLPGNEQGFLDTSTPVLHLRVYYFHTGPPCLSFTPTLISRQYFHFIQSESLFTLQSGGGVVGIVTILGPGRSGVQFLVGTGDFSLPIQPISQWAPRFFCLGLNRPGREVNHSSLPSADVKTGWSCTSTPPTRLHGIDRENFKFPVTVNQRRT